MQPRTRYVRGPEGHVAYQVSGRARSTSSSSPIVQQHRDHVGGAGDRALPRAPGDDRAASSASTSAAPASRIRCRSARCRRSSSGWTTSRTVIDAVGCGRVVMFGHGDGGPMAMLFAATYPERTAALVLADTFARMRHAPDYPDGLSAADAERKATRSASIGASRIAQFRATGRAAGRSTSRRTSPGARDSSGCR